TAIIVGVQDIETRHLYLIDADIQRASPDDTINAILAKCKAWTIKELVVEGNGFQALYAKSLRERASAQSIQIRVEEVKHSMNKIGRITAMQPYISTGQVLFSRRHAS